MSSIINTMAHDGYYPVPSIASNLAVSRSTIYRWIEEEKAKSRRHANRVYVYASDLEQYVDPAVFKRAMKSLIESSHPPADAAASTTPRRRRRRRTEEQAAE